ASRLIVTEGIHDRFVEAMAHRMSGLRIGDALHVDTHIGPASSEAQLRQDLDYVEGARTEGAVLAAGGGAADCHTGSGKRGFFVAPTLLTETTPSMRINREEVFGPVASVIRVRDYDEALAVANDTPFGLSSGIA